MKKAFLLLCILNALTGFSQPGKSLVNDGVYSGFQNNGQTSLYLFKSDSTFLFCGFTQQNKYTITNGTWNETKDSLMLTYLPSELNSRLFLYNAPLVYVADSKPSPDSVYFDIEVEGIPPKADGCQVQFSKGLIIKTDPSGMLKIALPMNIGKSITKLIFLGANKNLCANDGPLYESEIMLTPGKNSHTIKIIRQNKESVPFSTTEKEWHTTLYNAKVISGNETYYASSFAGLKKIDNKNDVVNYFKKIKTTYPILTQYIEKAEIKFRAYFP